MAVKEPTPPKGSRYIAEDKTEQIDFNNCGQLKLIATRIATNYDCNIKIEISVDKNTGSVIINVIEYDIKNL